MTSAQFRLKQICSGSGFLLEDGRAHYSLFCGFLWSATRWGGGQYSPFHVPFLSLCPALFQFEIGRQMFPTIPVITFQLFLFEIHRSSPPNERHKIKTISNAIVYNCFLGGVIGQWVADLAERGVLYCLWFQFILCRREHFRTQRCFGFSVLIYWTTTLPPPLGSNKNN